jgi:hypothetical protein
MLSIRLDAVPCSLRTREAKRDFAVCEDLAAREPKGDAVRRSSASRSLLLPRLSRTGYLRGMPPRARGARSVSGDSQPEFVRPFAHAHLVSRQREPASYVHPFQHDSDEDEPSTSKDKAKKDGSGK